MTIGLRLQLGERRDAREALVDRLAAGWRCPCARGRRRSVGAPLAWKEMKSSGVPVCAGRVVRAAQTVLEKVLHELAAAAGDVRAADARRRQRAAHAAIA